MRSAGDAAFLHRAVRSFCAAALCLCPAPAGHAAAAAGTMWVEEIGLERFSQRRGAPRVGRSIRDKRATPPASRRRSESMTKSAATWVQSCSRSGPTTCESPPAASCAPLRKSCRASLRRRHRPGLPFTARGLPAGLAIDASTGIISGKIEKAGESVVQLSVRGSGGAARSELRIVGGKDALALTPPMGWNSWNVWGPAVDAEKVLQAAEWLDRSGLAARGFQYVVIDDAWSGKRGTDGQIVPNEKFPDMRALADAVHARGLKLGIYSSPGPRTCEDFAGSWQYARLGPESAPVAPDAQRAGPAHVAVGIAGRAAVHRCGLVEAR